MCKIQRSPPPLSTNPSSDLYTEAKPLTRPTIDATAALDGVTALHESIMAQPLSRPHYDTPPRLDIVDALQTNIAPLRSNHRL
jgi:hypothetical protein